MNPHVIVFSHLLTTVDKGKKEKAVAKSDPFAISITITLWLSNGAFEVAKKLHSGNEMTASGLMTFTLGSNAVNPKSEFIYSWITKHWKLFHKFYSIHFSTKFDSILFSMEYLVFH